MRLPTLWDARRLREAIADFGIRPAFTEGRERGVRMATLVELRCEIDARMHRGASFSSIEDDVIDSSGLSEEEKSALWLYGWSFVELSAQRREAGAHIAELDESRTRRERPLELVASPSRG
jgi:hypothetical protein